MAGADQLPEGLEYFSEVVPDDLAEELAEFFESETFQADLFGVTAGNSRQVAHYGFEYSYTARSTKGGAPAMPEIIERVRELISVADGACDRKIPDPADFNQCIINRYLPGQGIGAHTDNKSYGPVIVCFTIGGGREMEFSRDRNSEPERRTEMCICRVFTEPGSMYVMAGESRTEWKHEMKGRKTDPNPDPAAKPRRISRNTSYSITFREVSV